MRLALTILCVALLATPASAELGEMIAGGWEWISTTYDDGTVVTSATLGHTVQLEFGADGSFSRYHDYTLQEESEWGPSYVWVVIAGGMVHLELIETATGDRWEPETVIPRGLLELRRADGGLDVFVYMGATSEEPIAWGTVKARFRGAAR